MVNDSEEVAELRRRLAEAEARAAAGASLAPPPAPKPASKSAFGGRLIAAIAVVAVIGFAISIADENKRTQQAAANLASSVNESEALIDAVKPAEASVEPAGAWRYSEDVDQVTDKATSFACSTSEGTVRLDPPYGPVSSQLCIRHAPRSGLNIYFGLVGDGQIMCRSYEACTITVRFDDKPAQRFSAIGPSDGSSNMIFIQNAERMLAGLSKAKRTLLEVEYYQAGRQVSEFNTEGLEWPRPKKVPVK